MKHAGNGGHTARAKMCIRDSGKIMQLRRTKAAATNTVLGWRGLAAVSYTHLVGYALVALVILVSSA